MALDWTEILLRLGLSSFFGALIGLERERKNWNAGMRTHMMVCLGSCLIMLVSSFGFSDVLGYENVTLDPSRVAAQVVSGIGFIGAGTILFQNRRTIRGLTTAAGLWTVAAIGLAVGGGMYIAAFFTTVFAILILWALQPLEKRYARKFVQQNLKIITYPDLGESNFLENLMDEKHFSVKSINMEKRTDEYVFNVSFESVNMKKMSELIETLHKHEVVKEVFWSN